MYEIVEPLHELGQVFIKKLKNRGLLLEKKVKDAQLNEKMTIVNYITSLLADYIKIKNNINYNKSVRY
jgi:hypothetical protein